ncbi:MAG: RNA-guided endonuclease IscB [Candidatus Methanoperedens sp.]|nr:RNA-guided endonuclease IscB [Candidatus Methanoperedens sp.]MCZ7398848.1 RNA-guided endonuclease IscB [Candidatus Methanoperedens sp.]
MQQLEERDTYTPTDIPHIRSNCDLALNREETLSVPDLKTSSNNSDAALTAKGYAGQDSRVSAVYILNMRGQPLMPTTPRKARILLKEDKAKVIKRTPFTIQLKYATGETKQEITLGIDSGYENIGLSAITNKKEVYSADIKLRTDLVKLNSERRQYRRARRNRNTWYRKPRFLNRKKPEGWLAPSIQHKLDSHIKLINKEKEILPITKINVEVAAFDIQKIKNPEISGLGYQNGVKKDSWNTREYVLHRDNHTCQACHGKSKDPILETHHINSRQIGGNAPDNLLTLCHTCHERVSKGKLKLDVKLPTGFKPETFMSTVRWKLVDMLRYTGNVVNHTYGYITKSNRIALGLEKSHSTDAFVIAGGTIQERSSSSFLIQQVRKCNRKLFKGDRSHLKNTAPRLILGFQRFDKVLWNNIECFVFGRRKAGYFDLRQLDGTKVHASAKAKDITLLQSANTFLIEPLRWGTLLHTLKSAVSVTPAPHGGL